MTPGTPALRRAALGMALAGASSAVAATMAAAGVATYFARRVVTPDAVRLDNCEVTAFTDDTVTLRQNPDTRAPGRYGLWLDRGAAHVRLGEVLSRDDTAGTVTRTVLGLDVGNLVTGPARWNQYYFAGDPLSACGLDYRPVDIPSPSGPLPCWLVPGAGDEAESGRWAVLLHGRGATREECLRALPLLHRLGITALVVSYRNDPDVSGSRGVYHLGDTEWRDVESALREVAERGAREVVVLAWSMGAAIALQAMSRSEAASGVLGLVLDAPVLDWRPVLAHHASLNRLPAAVGRFGQRLMSHESAWRLVGLEAPIDFDRLDWVTRSGELTRPMLVVHSRDDEFVPVGSSVALAAARPDLVTFYSPPLARHAKEWNVDQAGWDSAVARFLLEL